MVDNYLKWQKEVNLQELGSINMQRYEKMKEITCHGYCHTDKLGRPVYIDRAKFLKAKECFKEFSDEELIQYYV